MKLRAKTTASPIRRMRTSVGDGWRESSRRDRGISSIDHLVRSEQERLRYRQPQSLRGLQIDDELELGRLLDGQIRGLGASEDLVDVGCRAAIQGGVVRAVRNEASRIDIEAFSEHCGQTTLSREAYQASSLIVEHRIEWNEN